LPPTLLLATAFVLQETAVKIVGQLERRTSAVLNRRRVEHAQFNAWPTCRWIEFFEIPKLVPC
jgi:hypothetical protein